MEWHAIKKPFYYEMYATKYSEWKVFGLKVW